MEMPTTAMPTLQQDGNTTSMKFAISPLLSLSGGKDYWKIQPIEIPCVAAGKNCVKDLCAPITCTLLSILLPCTFKKRGFEISSVGRSLVCMSTGMHLSDRPTKKTLTS